MSQKQTEIQSMEAMANQALDDLGDVSTSVSAPGAGVTTQLGDPSLTARRRFLQGLGLIGAAGVAASSKVAKAAISETQAAAQKLGQGNGLSFMDAMGDFFQQHYTRMSDEEMKEALERIERKAKRKFGVDISCEDIKPMPGTYFGYALNLSKCRGYRECVYGCIKENNQGRDSQMQYIRVLEMPNGDRNLEHSNHYYDPETVPTPGKWYLPVQCQQCDNPPCVKACPVEATWKDDDGIVVIDYNWCIGCRMCMAACPYWARHFNWTEPQIPAEELNPVTNYIGNRPRPKGVVEKCHFCTQRTRKGRQPACMEACPTGARVFGNLLDPDSDIRWILKNKIVWRLKEDLGTEPKFWYFTDEARGAGMTSTGKLTFFSFIKDGLGAALHGGKLYWTWIIFLLVLIGITALNYYFQITEGMQITGMSDQVSWGFYIANFAFFVGIAAAAVLLVVPAYIFHRADVKSVVLIGEGLAVAAVVVAMGFVAVDIGRIDRAWHVIPFLGKFNWPSSMLAWDIIVLNGYLFLNLLIPMYILWHHYRGKEPNVRKYFVFVVIAMFWAISIHTVTAFLFSSNISRPFWHTALLAPRFIASAFTAGPALMIVTLLVLRRFTDYPIRQSIIDMLALIMAVSMQINIYFVAAEMFTDFYNPTEHAASMQYLFLGLSGFGALKGWIWTALALNIIAAILLMVHKTRTRMSTLVVACVLGFTGIWIEKGMGLVVTGFIPSPLGEIFEYAPTLKELGVSVGIYAVGCLVFTILAKAGMAIEMGKVGACKPSEAVLKVMDDKASSGSIGASSPVSA